MVNFRSKYHRINKLACWWRKVSPVRVLEKTSTGQSGHHKSPSVSQIILRPDILPKNYFGHSGGGIRQKLSPKHQASVLVA